MIEHSNKAWGDFLRTVKASRGANVQVTGQPLADELLPVVQVADEHHLTQPLRWASWGIFTFAGAVAAEYSIIEIGNQVPFWVNHIDFGSTAVRIYTSDVSLSGGADQVPPSVFGEAGALRYRIGSNTAAPPTDAWGITQTGTRPFDQVFKMPSLYVPRGRWLIMSGIAVNTLIIGGLLVTEVPDARDAP